MGARLLNIVLSGKILNLGRMWEKLRINSVITKQPL